MTVELCAMQVRSNLPVELYLPNTVGSTWPRLIKLIFDTELYWQVCYLSQFGSRQRVSPYNLLPWLPRKTRSEDSENVC